MKIAQHRKLYFTVTIIIMAFALTACASQHSKTSGKALSERVNGLMQARINNDWAVIYTYYDASFRNKESKEVFLNKTREMLFTGYTIDSIEVLPSGNEAAVTVLNDVKMKGFDFKNNREIQNWVKEDGEWFLEVKADGVKMR